MTMWRMRMSKATNTHTGCEIFTAFPLQQWFHEHAWMLLYTYLSCLVLYLAVIT